MKIKILTYYIIIAFSIFFHQIVWVSAADAANKIMPLGDSITEGNENFDEASYRRRLYKLLTGELLLTGVGYNPDFVGSLVNGIPDDFDKDNEGRPGWTDDQIVNGRPGSEGEGQLSDWLDAHQPQIVLLHIGTNGLDPSPDDVEAILDEIDAFSPNVWVVLARIINRNCITDNPSCPESVTTMNFNTNVVNMAQARILLEDKIIIVDMENGDVDVAVIDYHLDTDNPPGDMWDNLHPSETGYDKMADLWFSGLMEILPQADAGDTQTMKETATVTLDGSNSSDADGTIDSYSWMQTAGTTVTLTFPLPATATFTAPDVTALGETLTFQLTVTDNDGLESSDTVSVDVIDRINPVADAGLDQDVTEGDKVTLDGTGSTDADGTIASYLWEQVPAATVTLSNAATDTATFTAPDRSAGATLTFQLTVTDNDGLTSNDTINVNVSDKIRPVANAGADQDVDEFEPVTLDGSNSSDSDGTVVSYLWEQVPVATVTLTNAATDTATFTAPDVGSAGATLTFQLTVTDDDGLESTDTVKINVRNPNSSNGGGGGGGGGGCFITTSGYGSSMAPSGNSSFVAPPGIPAAPLELVVAMIAFISICAAIVLHRRRKRWIKPLYL